jgi:hypothetical protein
MASQKEAIYNGGYEKYGEFGITTPDQRADSHPFKTLVHPGHERTSSDLSFGVREAAGKGRMKLLTLFIVGHGGQSKN